VLLDFLQSHGDEVFSADQIAESLNGENISISAIYRNLAALESEGKIQRTTKGGSRKVFYRFKAADECREHIHLSCSKCGRTYHMPLPATNTLIDDVKKNSGFEIDRTETVLYGVCGDCKK
jgi:Fur family ferric uptake transcriptional regulator